MEFSKKPPYKYCIVPLCKSTTFTAPDKYFFNVPRIAHLRKKWCKIMKRDTQLSDKTPLYCCEDHFNVQDDTENYMEYHMKELEGRNVILRLKKDVLPHRFHCQKKTEDKPMRGAFAKRRKMELLHDAMTPQISLVPEAEIDVYYPQPIVPPIENENSAVIMKSNDKAVQVNFKLKYRSKCIGTTTKTMSVALSPFQRPCLKNAWTSPVKVGPLVKKKLFNDTRSQDTISMSSKSLVASTDYEPETSNSEVSWKHEAEISDLKNKMRSGFIEAIEREPKLFLGLPKNSYYLIKLLSDNTAASTVDILITLKKIKLNDSFNVLAVHFGYSQSTVSRIFKKTIRLLANSLSGLIIWPNKARVIQHLPIAFRARYSSVYSIIDCLEVEIEKPTNAVHQSQSWSQYKKCNTAKYLISCTPDGLVTFISEGYGGRASDVNIVENCGYLEKLPSILIGTKKKNKTLLCWYE